MVCLGGLYCAHKLLSGSTAKVRQTVLATSWEWNTVGIRNNPSLDIFEKFIPQKIWHFWSVCFLKSFCVQLHVSQFYILEQIKVLIIYLKMSKPVGNLKTCLCKKNTFSCKLCYWWWSVSQFLFLFRSSWGSQFLVVSCWKGSFQWLLQSADTVWKVGGGGSTAWITNSPSPPSPGLFQ